MFGSTPIALITKLKGQVKGKMTTDNNCLSKTNLNDKIYQVKRRKIKDNWYSLFILKTI